MYAYLRQKIRAFVLDFLSFNSTPKPGIHILNGHFISLDNSKSSEVFYHLIKELLDKGVELIDFKDAVALIVNKKIDVKKCYVSFTFDDGFEECYTKIAPVLNKFNNKACFFINPGFINGDEKYKINFLNNIVFTQSGKKSMTWNQIKELKSQGHTIGSHTMDHCRLNGNDENYPYQIGESQKIIEQQLNTTCDYFAYTYGKLSDFSKDALIVAQTYHKYIFSQDNYKNYNSFDGKVINRRHFECDWKSKHVIYFLQNKNIKK